jgi:Fic family protein
MKTPMRQLALLENAVDNPMQQYTVVSHSQSHRSSYETARKDLLRLEAVGLLVKSKSGRANTWTPAPDIHAKLKAE